MEKEKHFGEVQFKPTVLLDPVGYGGRLKVGEVFTGCRKENKVYFRDFNSREWVFWIGQTCELV